MFYRKQSLGAPEAFCDLVNRSGIHVVVIGVNQWARVNSVLAKFLLAESLRSYSVNYLLLKQLP